MFCHSYFTDFFSRAYQVVYEAMSITPFKKKSFWFLFFWVSIDEKISYTTIDLFRNH